MSDQRYRVDLDDIRTYCRIVTAIAATLSIQAEIDNSYANTGKHVVLMAYGDDGHTPESCCGSDSGLEKNSPRRKSDPHHKLRGERVPNQWAARKAVIVLSFPIPDILGNCRECFPYGLKEHHGQSQKIDTSSALGFSAVAFLER